MQEYVNESVIFTVWFFLSMDILARERLINYKA